LRIIGLFLIFILLSVGKPVYGFENNNSDLDRTDRHQARIFFSDFDKVPQFSLIQSAGKAVEFSDTKISETVSPANFCQKNSSIALLEDGHSVVVWQDDRLGSFNLYGQIIDSLGGAISGNIYLAGRNDGYNSIEPKAVSDGDGGFILAWRDEISGGLYAARYDSNLIQTKLPFKINVAMTYAGPFDIDSYGASHFVLVWEDYGPSSKISLRFYTMNGVAITDTIRVSENNSAACWVPTVAIDGTGTIVVAWEDYRLGKADIFLQNITSSGSLSGSNIGVVEASLDDSAQYIPQVSSSFRDGFGIGWMDKRDGNLQVYMRQYLPATGFSGGSFAVSDPDSVWQCWDIAMDVGLTGDLVIGWATTSANESILLQMFTDNFAPDGEVIRVNSFEPETRWQTALKVSQSGRIICSWTDFRSADEDIFLELIDVDGSRLLVEDKLVNDDLGGAPSIQPDINIINDTLAFVLFSDAREDAGDIYLQTINSDGILISDNIRLNMDSGSYLQDNPAGAVSTPKLFTIWSDSRPVLGQVNRKIFGRALLPDMSLSGNDFIISDSTEFANKLSPAVNLTPNGDALAAWVDYREGDPQIYGQIVRADNSLYGGNFRISAPATDIENDNVRLFEKGSLFCAIWLSRGYAGGAAIVIARDSGNGAFDDRIIYSSPFGGITINEFSAAVDENGNYYLLWEGIGSEKQLYLTSVSSDGTIINQGLEITSRPVSENLQPSLTYDVLSGLLTAVWIDSRDNNRHAYYQIFDTDLMSFSNGSVSSTTPDFMSEPTVASSDNQIWFGWSDPRDGGLNIYARQMIYTPTDVAEDETNMLPIVFKLEQNYPNPFNPSTVISFTIPTKELVNVSVFDLLGRKVTTLTNLVYTAGQHRVLWDGCDSNGRAVASGVYFYRMTCAESQLGKKMLLLK